jgi:hypothetical protein
MQLHYRGLGVSPTCERVVWTYFGGFLLLALGLIVVIFGLLSTRRAVKRRSKIRNPSLASQYRAVDRPSERGPTP